MLHKQICIQEARNVFGKFQKHIFVFFKSRFCVFNKCSMWTQTRKHLGNTEELLILYVSGMVPPLPTHATYDEDAECLRSKKCFALFSFAYPRNIMTSIDTIFLQ